MITIAQYGDTDIAIAWWLFALMLLPVVIAVLLGSASR